MLRSKGDSELAGWHCLGNSDFLDAPASAQENLGTGKLFLRTNDLRSIGNSWLAGWHWLGKSDFLDALVSAQEIFWRFFNEAISHAGLVTFAGWETSGSRRNRQALDG